MAIQYADMKLMKSQRLDDSSEGGGMMTGLEVVDGEMNNLFPDISRLDRTYGRVQLRKAFPAVMTDNRNTYYGAHIVTIKPAEDKNAKCCMFTTKSSTDERSDAVERLEEYVVKGYRLYSYMLMGKHVAGAQSLLVQQNTADDLPASNSVLYLEELSGSGGEYVKIQKVNIKSENTSTKKRTIELLLWSPTQYQHNGFHYDNQGRIVIDTYFYTTVVSDAVHYYGISKLTQPAANGDSFVKAESMFHNLVPCAQSAGALSNQDAAMAFGAYTAGRDDNTKITLASGSFTPVDGTITIYCLTGIEPGSLEITGYGTSTDDGNGNISGGFSGTADYITGKILLNINSTSSYGLTVKAIPAVNPNRKLYTIVYPITLETQTSVFTRSIRPYPKTGSFFVKYMAQGNWYTLKDNGDGTVSGASTDYGSGTIDYEAGNFNITLGALPDVGSSVIFGWGTEIDLLQLGGTDADKFFIDLTFTDEATPGTLQITYTAGGVTKTVTDDGKGNLTGDGTGVVHYSSKSIRLYPAYLPDVGTAISIQHSKSNPQNESFDIADITDNGDGTFTATLTHSILAGSLDISFGMKAVVTSGNQAWAKSANYITSTSLNSIKVKLRDDGNGKIIGDVNSSVDYTNGKITFSKTRNIPCTYKYWEKDCWSENISGLYGKPESVYVCGWLWKSDADNDTAYTCDYTGNTFAVSYADSDAANTTTEDITDYSVDIYLASARTCTIEQASLLFSFDTQNYIDREGNIYKGLNYTTGQMGAKAGTIDYTGGLISLSDWQSGAANSAIHIDSLVGIVTPITVSDYAFTTSAAPIQVGSFQVLFTRADTSELVMVTADNSGYINGNGVYGQIDWQTGIVKLKFGDWVADDADAQNQPWYSESLVSNGQVLKPIPVFIESIKYNAVAIEYIPLDPNILGLNPLRLPTDGRVPIFRKGDVVIIHNTQQFTMPDNLTAGQIITLPRGDLSYIDLFDSDGNYVSKEWFSADLVNGKITMSDPLDLSAYTQPLIAYHRREDMRLVTDAQIDGTLKLIEPIEHDYDTDYTYVSSALLMGDLYASVYNIFDQKSWTGAWSNSRIGDPCTANYDLIHYPIETTNKGSIAERWAIIFTSSTNFKVVGENVGEIATGDTSQDCAPINPATNTPYFTIHTAGWGAGWGTNNVLRFNTTAAHYPVWFARTVLIGDATAQDDNFKIQIRGDAD